MAQSSETSPVQNPRPAVFFDRDGTLMEDKHYLSDPEGVVLLPHAPELLRQLQADGYLLVVVTNQSGVGRKLVTVQQCAAVAARFEELLKREGITLDGVYSCLHGPDDQCECRKPKPGLLLAAGRDLSIDFKQSFIVGDRPSDCQVGLAVGCCRAILLRGEHTPPAIPPEWMFAETLAAVYPLIAAARANCGSKQKVSSRYAG